MSDDYRCPKCGSHRVNIGYQEIKCYVCGYSEPLIDYPICHQEHRRLCKEYGLPDPGNCEPEEQNLSSHVTGAAKLGIDGSGYLRIERLEEENRQLRFSLDHIYKTLSSEERPQQIPGNSREGKPNSRGIEI
jgi:hypothetical protein